MQVKDNTHPAAVKGDDPFESYAAAVFDWERADKAHHIAQVAVMFDGEAAAGDLKTAAAKLEWATDTAIIERTRAGRRWFDGLRFCTEDDELKLALKLLVVELFREVAEGLTDQLADLTAENAAMKNRLADAESRLENVEMYAVTRKGGVA